MAYMSKEEVKEVRDLIKKSFSNKYKFSVSTYHYSGINVALLASPIKYEQSYTQVNEYHIESQFKENHEMKDLLVKIKNLVHSVKPNYNRNANDLSADYGDMNYFLNLSIGKFDREYITKL